MKIKRKILKNSLLDVKTYFFLNLWKTLKKGFFYEVLEKKIYRKKRIKTWKLVVSAMLEKRNIVAKKNVFFGFLPLTNENKIKILKKSLFRQKFSF